MVKEILAHLGHRSSPRDQEIKVARTAMGAKQVVKLGVLGLLS